MQKKILTIALAALFAMSAFAIVVDSEDLDATSAGSTNVFVYNGTTWVDYLEMSGYNALQALQATGLAIEADTDYILEKENDWGPYTEMNLNYGNVTSIGGVAENDTNVWNVFVFNNGWVVGIDAIGYITPFTDGAAPSANLVMYYGADVSSVPTDVISHTENKTKELVDPSSLEGSTYSFNLKVTADGYEPDIAIGTAVSVSTSGGNQTVLLSESDLYAGITVIGTGSNAYAALKNAIGSANIMATEAPGAYYGWINELFGLTTKSSGSDYIYWTQNTATGNYLSFNLGAYSGLNGVPSDSGSSSENFQQTVFALEYVLYSYS